MSDWGNAFDDQCRSEGLEVPEKTEEVQSNSEMDQNEENRGFGGAGIGRGGMFGGGAKMNAPPPQTSFGATSGTRVGGSFGTPSGPDGRGAAIGSAEELNGGGNIISVGYRKAKPACSFTKSGSFGTNHSPPSISPSTIKTNHEGGRFGVLSPKTFDFVTKSSSDQPKPPSGGRFGAQSSISRTSVGGSFGSKPSSTTTNTTPIFGGIFNGKVEDVAPTKSFGGSFGLSTKSPLTAGRSFGSSIKSPISTDGNYGSEVSVTKSESVESTASTISISSRTAVEEVAVAKPLVETVSKPVVGGAFGASKSSSGISVGGAFGKKPNIPQPVTAPTPPPQILLGQTARISQPSSVEEIKIQTTENVSVGGSIGSKSFGVQDGQKTLGGSFGRAQPSNTLNAPPFGCPPPSFVKSSEEKLNETTSRSEENSEKTESSTLNSGTNFSEKSRSFGGGFGGNTFIPSNNTTVREGDKTEGSNVPFMSGPPPSMRGGFQGGYRGGRGVGGGQMDFGGPGQGPMGRGRGQSNQQFIPQQRAPPPSFPSHQNSQIVKPDPKYKYTKSTDDDHEKVPIPADIALLNKFIQKEVKMMKDTVVDVQRQDPKSPLYSISSFRELRLKPEVLQALDNLNFQFPTRIQETALPLLLMEPPSNLIAQAQSGTGKTAAFVLTMLCRIDVNLKCPQCICLAPTLELAKQIGEVVEKMGKYMENLKIHYAIKGGNMAAMRGRKLTEQIVIGTPGITRDYLQKYKCIDPSQIRCLVLDEADVMIYHQGFTDISTTIYNMVEEASESVQSMLFSATYDQPVIDFATKIIKNAIVVMLKREEQALPNIKQFYVQCACRDSKYAAIVNLYSGLAVASSVIFCHTKASVMWLYENMKARGHKVDVLHGDMTVVERADTIIRFKRGDFKVLITTNVFARGIDVAQVSVVINYDLPIKYNDENNPMVVDGFTQPDCETYLHRIGRTGRFGKTGIAINLIDSEDSMNMINVLESHFQMKIARMDPSNIVELEAIEAA
ncbi:hypothetical protein GCK72_005622 [Caenorhabditis remanei]|uniref:RNA helicase n=1 Tax=Caenorhabditis remanei TaxID=31234 RepID=A0A2P4WAS7_CAERE|nr:hypothetical protein GCK72_005622 [Caenorhabditis remanei]KAF1765669.1 hypothetical protein GCK72_005622 [Caenorhabditis remanei]